MLPGFIHDVCSAFHPLGVASPLMRSLPLHEYGWNWINLYAPLAHPLDDAHTPCWMLQRKAAEYRADARPTAV